MADFILIEDIEAAEKNAGMGAVVAGTLKRHVKRQPTVDTVDVVRCKDCEWYKLKGGCPLHRSGLHKDGKLLPLENDFCSYGERRCE